MRLERSITVLAAAVLAGWLLAVLLCNGLFYRNIVNYEILYHGMAECWAQAAVRSRTGKICLLAVRVLQVAAVACITCSRLRRTGSLFLGTAIGFCGGVFFSLLVWSCGMPQQVSFQEPVLCNTDYPALPHQNGCRHNLLRICLPVFLFLHNLLVQPTLSHR